MHFSLFSVLGPRATGERYGQLSVCKMQERARTRCRFGNVNCSLLQRKAVPTGECILKNTTKTTTSQWVGPWVPKSLTSGQQFLSMKQNWSIQPLRTNEPAHGLAELLVGHLATFLSHCKEWLEQRKRGWKRHMSPGWRTLPPLTEGEEEPLASVRTSLLSQARVKKLIPLTFYDCNFPTKYKNKKGREEEQGMRPDNEWTLKLMRDISKELKTLRGRPHWHWWKVTIC